MSDDDRNQPPRVLATDDPPPSPGTSRGLVSVLVLRLDTVRNQILDYDDTEHDWIWDEFRINVDRELRAIQLELASLCPPA